jgi:hypothetical protein
MVFRPAFLLLHPFPDVRRTVQDRDPCRLTRVQKTNSIDIHKINLAKTQNYSRSSALSSCTLNTICYLLKWWLLRLDGAPISRHLLILRLGTFSKGVTLDRNVGPESRRKVITQRGFERRQAGVSANAEKLAPDKNLKACNSSDFKWR